MTEEQEIAPQVSPAPEVNTPITQQSTPAPEANIPMPQASAEPAPIVHAPVPATFQQVQQPIAGVVDYDTFNIDKSLVQVYTTATRYDHTMPGNRPRSVSWRGSAVVIDIPGMGKHILTNAHVAQDARVMKVRVGRTDKEYFAETVLLGPECDLALLKVAETDAEAFDKATLPAPLWSGNMYELGKTIQVIGYPGYGEGICITQGVTSRLEHGSYSHSGQTLLQVRVDAAINGGNSGGPAIIDGQVAGLAFQGYSPAFLEGAGFIIPPDVITHFLTEYMRQEYKGFPELSFSVQEMQNNILKTALSIEDNEAGVLVNFVGPSSDAHKLLKMGDVIMAIDGYPISDLGNIKTPQGHELPYQHLINMKYIGEEVTFTVKRKGQLIQVPVTLNHSVGENTLMPPVYEDDGPSYYMSGGLIFQSFTERYLEDSMRFNQKLPWSLIDAAERAPLDEEEEVVFISTVLPADFTDGYRMARDIPILAVNNIKIQNLAHLVKVMDNNMLPVHTIVLNNGKILVVPNLIKMNPMLHHGFIIDNEMPGDRSDDLVNESKQMDGLKMLLGDFDDKEEMDEGDDSDFDAAAKAAEDESEPEFKMEDIPADAIQSAADELKALIEEAQEPIEEVVRRYRDTETDEGAIQSKQMDQFIQAKEKKGGSDADDSDSDSDDDDDEDTTIRQIPGMRQPGSILGGKLMRQAQALVFSQQTHGYRGQHQGQPMDIDVDSRPNTYYRFSS